MSGARMSLAEYRATVGMPADVDAAPPVRIGRKSAVALAVRETAKPNKYHARRTQGRDGRWYDSAKEAAYADKLLAQVSAGEIVGYIPQVSFPIGVDEKGNSVRYRLDFMVIRRPPETPRYVDVKGRDTQTSRTKRAALRSLGIDVELA